MFRTSSYSFANGNCVEVGDFRMSSACTGHDNCAEVGQGDTVIAVRDTKQAHLGDDRTVLEFSPEAWARFTSEIREGQR